MNSGAAVLSELSQTLEIRKVALQDPGPGEVRIQIAELSKVQI